MKEARPLQAELPGGGLFTQFVCAAPEAEEGMTRSTPPRPTAQKDDRSRADQVIPV